MQKITTPEELAAFADEHTLREDWHEPDEQGVSATVEGTEFDNAGIWPADAVDGEAPVEEHVILHAEGKPVAAVNLATVLSWGAHFGRMLHMLNGMSDDEFREHAETAAREHGVPEDVIAQGGVMVTPFGSREIHRSSYQAGAMD